MYFFHFLQKLITNTETYESIKSCSYTLYEKKGIFMQRPFFIIPISALTVCCHRHTKIESIYSTVDLFKPNQ